MFLNIMEQSSMWLQSHLSRDGSGSCSGCIELRLCCGLLGLLRCLLCLLDLLLL